MKIDFEIAIKLKLEADTKQIKKGIKKCLKSLVKAFKTIFI